MPDVWAHCPECDRWYYPGSVHEREMRCPVCSVRPDRTEDRAAHHAQSRLAEPSRQAAV